MVSSRISAILASVRALDGPIHVHGSTPAGRALIVARFQADRGSPIIVLCPNDDAAAELAADIETLSAAIEGRPLAVCHVPTWEQSPYSPIAPSIRARLARVAALSALSAQTQPSVIVTTLAAACQATIPPGVFKARSTEIRADLSVQSREALMLRLVDAGYLRVDPVEDPGTFAVRGDIIDVFAPDRERPVRIELFGDMVERIREFDPATQRAQPSNDALLPGLVIGPARETLINAETQSGLRERLKARADDLGISRSVRDPVLEAISHGVYPEHADAWAPFAYAEPATLWTHLSPTTEVVWSDELSCLQDWDDFQVDQKRLADDAVRAEVIAPAFAELFRFDPALDRGIRERSRLFLDRLELANLETFGGAKGAPSSELPQDSMAPHEPGKPKADLISARQRVEVRANSDLSTGGRHSLGDLEPKFKLWIRQGFRMLVLASTQSQLERIRFLLEQERDLPVRPGGALEPSVITLAIGAISEGFRWPAEGLVVLTEGEVLGARHKKRQRRALVSQSDGDKSAAKEWSGLQALADLNVGDAVVHVDHGIGRYQGLVRLDLSGAPSDFLQLEYANKDKLYLPVYRLGVIQKYVGSGEHAALDKLGTRQFERAKEKVREGVRKLAIDLVALYAERRVRPGVRFSPRDADFQEFEAKFPFDETGDQLKAIDAVLDDMRSGRVMDRLVCGDVGYGKTEVAIRAAFRAISDGKQVVVLVPTTVLAFQHEQSFKARLQDYPFTVDSVSRFKSAREQAKVLEGLAAGKVDVVIGTHRLLSRDVKFKDLGLVIVDEEHRFGVEHKEKLKTLKTNTHVLTLTATPIPRTLNMALSGLREISLINTPPVDRLPIRTYVSRYEESLIERAITFELSRGGQVFFLHNRVETIHQIANKIRELVPQAQIGVGHGQMAEGELEQVMINFYNRKTNVLISTTIIESGLDVPNANTILINRADTLGLAQLYQIRGRVGRGQSRAYAYLLIPPEGAISEDAKRRLEVIQRFVELGSGFSVASHDLEIRGGGDLLGPQQSGHINAVGFDLYTELLEEAIRELEGKVQAPEDSRREPEIKAPFPSFLGENYVPDTHQRLSLYRRFSGASDERGITLLEEELQDRFGPLPPEAQNLLWLIRIKLLLKRAGVDTLTVGPQKVSIVTGPHSTLDPVRTIALVSGRPQQYQLTPDSKLVVKVPTTTLRDLFFALEGVMKELEPPHDRASPKTK